MISPSLSKADQGAPLQRRTAGRIGAPFLFGCALLLLALFPNSAFSQRPDIRFERLTSDNGLSQNTVHSILQDGKGFMWFGTRDGLNRYDGYRFVVYAYNSEDAGSLPASTITALYADQDGMIWVGTEEGGLYRFDSSTETFTPFRHDPDNSASLSSDGITDIFEDREHVLWIGTKRGLNALDRLTGRITRYVAGEDDTHLQSDGILKIYQDRAGTLWFGTNGGLHVIDPVTGRITHYPVGPGEVQDILEDRDGQLWIAAGLTGLFTFDRVNQRFARYGGPGDRRGTIETAIRIVEDKAGILWVATSSVGDNPNGLIRLDKHTGNRYWFKNDPADSRSISANNLLDLYQDRAGNIWVGIAGKGVNRYSATSRFTSSTRFFKGARQNVGYSVQSFYADSSGILWVGSIGGLIRIDRRTGKSLRYARDTNADRPFPHSFIYTIYEDRMGLFWVGFGGIGLASLDRKTDRVTSYPQFDDLMVRAIHEDYQGILWIGTKKGALYRFDPMTGQAESFPLNPTDPDDFSAGTIYAIYEDRQHNIWLGTGNGGLVKMPRRPDGSLLESPKHYLNDPNDPQTITSNHVKYIYEDSEGILWIGTIGGLNRFDSRTEHFTRLTVRDGLPNNVIYGILEDATGDFWLSTNNGISHFDPTKGVFRNFNVKDGLQGNEFNTGACYRGPKGKMFFGGLNGFTSFSPDRVTDSAYRVPVMITGLDIGYQAALLNQPITETTQINLTHRDQVFSFEFAALDYTNPSKNRYAYMMDGFDPEWVETDATNRRATYTNMNPGAYTFRVKATNSDGVWNEEGAAIQVIVASAPWLTWWAYGLYGLMLVGVVMGFVRYQRQQLEGRHSLRERSILQSTNEELEKKNLQMEEAKDTAETANRAKSTFLANMSHEIRTPLNAILGYAQILQRAIDIPENHRRSIVTIESSGDHLMELINEILDLSKIEAGRLELQPVDFDLRGFISSISDMFLMRCKQKNLIWSLDVTQTPQDTFHVHGDEQKLRQVLINLLSNSVKFTDEGEVVLRISVEDIMPPVYLFEVTDTGVGISPKDQARVLEPFQQAGTKPVVGGTGLGLTIAQRMIELMGGTLHIESEIGHGSRFWFAIPLSQSDAAPGAAARVEERPVIALAEGHTVHALVVDDIDENRDILFKLLAGIGCEVRLANNGQEALDAIQAEQPDIVFMDIRMPVMDGSETARKIIENLGIGVIKLVAVTASALTHNRQTYLDNGFDEFISKPFKANQIYDSLVRLLQVAYIYDEAPTDNSETIHMTLPSGLLTSLSEAAVYGDLEALETGFDQLGRLGDAEHQLAEHLRQLSENLDMTAIKDTLERIGHDG